MQVFGCFLFVYMLFFLQPLPSLLVFGNKLHPPTRVLYGSARPVPPRPVWLCPSCTSASMSSASSVFRPYGLQTPETGLLTFHPSKKGRGGAQFPISLIRPIRLICLICLIRLIRPICLIRLIRLIRPIGPIRLITLHLTSNIVHPPSLHPTWTSLSIDLPAQRSKIVHRTS